jgi:poly(glycerol-phosphate) alpha-glucosyltransferase
MSLPHSVPGRLLEGLRIGLLSAWSSPLGGGVFEAVAAQAALIRSQGGTAIVFGLADEQSAASSERLAPSQSHALAVRGPAAIGFAPRLTPSLLAEDLDCLHLNGIWMYPSRAATRWAQRTGRPYIVSPHGMLDPWILSRGRLKKLAARIGYERASWRSADAFHALTEREAGEILNATGRTAELIIPNAAPALLPSAASMPAPRVTYIGRIHPKKNLQALVRAWTAARLPSESRLTLAGWGTRGDVAALEQAVRHAGPQVEFIGPIHGPAKRELLAQSRFLVLPSFGEGLPMAVLEAWAAGVPTILTAECNLLIGFSSGAAIECGVAPPSIVSALEGALGLTETEWRTMSAASRELAGGPFSARTVGLQWARAYRSLTGRDTEQGCCDEAA